MLQRLLNNVFGLYTEKQFLAAINRNVELQEKITKLEFALKTSEEVKAKAVEEKNRIREELRNIRKMMIKKKGRR